MSEGCAQIFAFFDTLILKMLPQHVKETLMEQMEQTKTHLEAENAREQNFMVECCIQYLQTV